MSAKKGQTAGCITILLMIPISCILKGLVLRQLWEWFVIPQFGLAPLTIGYALGLSLIVSYMTYQTDDTKPPDRTAGEAVIRVIFLALFQPAFIYAFGWIVVKCQGR